MLKFRRTILQAGAGLLISAAAAAQPAAETKGPTLAPTSASTTSIWLMGEVHDNPQVHQSRYAIIAAKVKAGWRPAIAMEQFDREHQSLLRTAQVECNTADCITSRPWVENWEWPLYAPLIQLALDYKLPLLAVNVSRKDANRIVQGGYSAALDPDTIAYYKLDQTLPEPLARQHRQNIVEGHCNMLPASVADKMVPAQVARDVWMAKVIEQQASQTDVVLIAGNGHVQKDVGVLHWLPVTLQSRTTVHGFLEHEPGQAQSTFDVVHSVPRFVREDPCEAFKVMKK